MRCYKGNGLRWHQASLLCPQVVLDGVPLPTSASLFYPKVLVRRWGRIRTRRVRSIKLVLEDAEAVWREVQEISRLRGRHGYALVREVRGAVIGAEAA